jgi:hypothetical protein
LLHGATRCVRFDSRVDHLLIASRFTGEQSRA